MSSETRILRNMCSNYSKGSFLSFTHGYENVIYICKIHTCINRGGTRMLGWWGGAPGRRGRGWQGLLFKEAIFWEAQRKKP